MYAAKCAIADTSSVCKIAPVITFRNKLVSFCPRSDYTPADATADVTEDGTPRRSANDSAVPGNVGISAMGSAPALLEDKDARQAGDVVSDRHEENVLGTSRTSAIPLQAPTAGAVSEGLAHDDTADFAGKEGAGIAVNSGAFSKNPSLASSDMTEVHGDDAPALPPFLKGDYASSLAVSAVAPTQQANDEANTSAPIEAIQIDGLGNVGNTMSTPTGCKCVVM